MNSNNSNIPNKPDNSKHNPKNKMGGFGNKNKKKKNKNLIQHQIMEDSFDYYKNVSKTYLSDNISHNTNSDIDTNTITNTITNANSNKINSPNSKNFYANRTESKSLNNIKIKELKDSIRKNNSYNIIGDIIFELGANIGSGTGTGTGTGTDVSVFRTKNQFEKEMIENNKSSSYSDFCLLEENKFNYLTVDEYVDIENLTQSDNMNNMNNMVEKKIILKKSPSTSNTNNLNQNTIQPNTNANTNANTKSNIKKNLSESKTIIKFEEIKDLETKMTEINDYNFIQSPFKIIGEEILNNEINIKYKSKSHSKSTGGGGSGNITSDNNQIIKKLKEQFKKLVYKEIREKPNVSQILLDSTLPDDVKLKIFRKYIKFTTEDEVFSDQADKIKIEINNLIKQKKINSRDDYDELGKLVEKKISEEDVPIELKTKIEDIYYRVIEGDQPKLHNLLNNILKLPFESKPNILDQMSKSNISDESKSIWIKSLYDKLDASLYGMEETKDSIISWICQKINNPSYSSSKYLCLCGPAGVGKTSIINLISECLSIPHYYISLANIDEPGSLIGHGYTYEGSQCGMIANGIIRNGCTNGILLFDEIDKAKEKVQNTLLGIFDPLQNSKFRDAFFGEFYLNLSKCMMILCLNDLDKLNPILRDRLHIINIPGYSNEDKKIIIHKHIIPKLETIYNISVKITEDVIDIILNRCVEHKGIRQVQMYLTKIYELVVLDKYTNKYNFGGIFNIDNSHLLKFDS